MRSPSQPVARIPTSGGDDADRLRVDALARVVLEDAREIRRQVREEEAVEARRAGEQRATNKDGRRVRLQQFPERLARRQAAHARELGRLFERSAQHEAQHAAEAAEDERDAPRHSAATSVGRQQRAQREADAGRGGHAHRDAGEHDAAHERRDPRSGLDDIGERAGQLAAETEALHQPQRHHQRAGRDAPLRVRRHESHAERRARHHEHRPQEHPAPAVAIAVVAEDDAADRPREVAGRKCRERRHQRYERRAAGKDGVGDVAREDAEDDEVVELERAAEAGEQHDAPAGGGDAIAPRRYSSRGGIEHAVKSSLAAAARQDRFLPQSSRMRALSDAGLTLA